MNGVIIFLTRVIIPFSKSQNPTHQFWSNPRKYCSNEGWRLPLTSHINERATLHLYLKELYILPTEYSGNKLVSKGFFDAVTIQDFPIRGQSVFYI